MSRVPVYRDTLGFEDTEGDIFGDMQRDMDRRRKEWESEIERMRKDFFTLKPTGKLDTLSDNYSSRYSDQLDDAKGIIERDHNGQPVFRVRFDVKNFKPEEVNVKTDSHNVQVQARHESHEGGSKITREYNREVAVPKEVDPMALQCTMTPDGYLFLEAPMPVPQYSQIHDVNSSRIQAAPSPRYQSTTINTSSASSPRVHTLDSHFSPSPTYARSQPVSVETEKKYKVEVDIEDFKPEDLTVKTVDKKLLVSAKREERIGNRSSTKEMSREFQLPDMVDPTTVKAYFSDNGKLLVEAPYNISRP